MRRDGVLPVRSAAVKSPALARHAEPNVRKRSQPCLGDGLVAVVADAVSAVLYGREGNVYLTDGRLRLCSKGEVPLTVNSHGAALSGLLVELHVSGLAFESERLCFSP